VVGNLLSNARKFTDPGGRVTVRVAEEGGEAVLAVADTGVGIARADQERLFERFYRTADAAERGVPGVGLGLTIVQAIAQGHGGGISVASAPGAGTTFTVRLPLTGALSAPAARARAVAAPEG
jgi:signal transduction histidine kinase